MKVLLQLKQRDTNDPFKCLVMKPIFLRRNDHTNDILIPLEHIWKSSHSHELFGVTILVATSNDGYVYQFSNNGKQSRIIHTGKMGSVSGAGKLWRCKFEKREHFLITFQHQTF